MPSETGVIEGFEPSTPDQFDSFRKLLVDKISKYEVCESVVSCGRKVLYLLLPWFPPFYDLVDKLKARLAQLMESTD